MTEDITRRTALGAAAWSLPVVALAIATPAAAASTTPPPALACVNDDPDVEGVTILGTTLFVAVRATARNAIDVTIRQAGEAEIHLNLTPPGTPTNGNPREVNYTPGRTVGITLTRPYDLSRDWLQVKTVHNENCVAA